MQDGKKTVMQTSLGPRDLKDYVLDGKPTANQAPPAAAPSVHVDTRKPPSAPPADPDAQDGRGLRESDRRARAVASASEELASQIQGDIAESDFDAAEVLPGLELFAKQSGVPADELRQEVLARIRKSGLKPADIRRIERALDPTRKSTPAAPTNAKPPAPQTRPEQLIELRKRLSVLNQLLECLG